MTPETLPLTARRNVPYVEEFTFTDEDGNALDLTDCEGALQVRQYGAQPGDAEIDLANVLADATEGVWLSEPGNGKVQVWIDEASTAAIPAASEAGGDVPYVYDLVITWPDGLEETFLEGPFTIKPGVTV